MKFMGWSWSEFQETPAAVIAHLITMINTKQFDQQMPD